MGYYSEVAIGMDNYEAVNFLNEGTKIKCGSGLFEVFELILRDEYAIIRWPEIKWYDDFEDVAWVMEYLNRLAENEQAVAFVRVGEDSGDNEAWYCDNDGSLRRMFWIKSSIEFAA